MLSGAIACGALFGAVKFFEWSAKFGVGLTPMTNDFFMFYFVLTGIYMLHVVIGRLVLLFLARTRWLAKKAGASQRRNLESGATFWHLVDLIWIILFALFYLVP